MIVLPRYTLPPYVCYHCRTDRVPTVYTQREDEDARGPNSEHIFFCYECLLHAAREVAPLVGHAVVSLVKVEEATKELTAMTEAFEAASRERDLAVAARDAVVASLAANPLPLSDTFTEGSASVAQADVVNITEGSGAKRWRDRR